MGITLLDGPMGTELGARGVQMPAPAWSAAALEGHADVVCAIHRDYAAAGAQVHTANTFRTKRRIFPDRWEALAASAVELARRCGGGRIAGSIAPLEDCYSPWLSPPDPGPEHAELARHLVCCGCDLLLVETFPHVGEGLAAVEAAVATGVETWACFTAGPAVPLLSAEEIAAGCLAAARLGARGVGGNCVPARATLPDVRAIACAVADLPVEIVVYANAGHPDEGLGWVPDPLAPTRYLDLARGWVEAGATVVGACCGCGPAVISALARGLG